MGVAPDTTLYESPWPTVNRWDGEIVNAENQVYADTGVWVPSNVVKSVEEIETGGDWPDPANYAGAAGVMQVSPGAMGSYDMGRVVSDKQYSMWAGVEELALREKDSGFMPWRNVAVGYFSGHYQPTGAGDAYSTDYQYLDQFDKNMSQMRPAGDTGLPNLDSYQYGNVASAAGSGALATLTSWGARFGLFLLGAALLAGGLWFALRGAA